MALWGLDPYRLIWSESLRQVDALMGRLSKEPWSQWRAEELDDERWFGYTPEAARLDNVTDWLQNVWQTTTQSYSGKKKVKRPAPVERPQSKKTEKPTDLEDVGSFFAEPQGRQ